MSGKAFAQVHHSSSMLISDFLDRAARLQVEVQKRDGAGPNLQHCVAVFLRFQELLVSNSHIGQQAHVCCLGLSGVLQNGAGLFDIESSRCSLVRVLKVYGLPTHEGHKVRPCQTCMAQAQPDLQNLGQPHQNGMQRSAHPPPDLLDVWSYSKGIMLYLVTPCMF
jgi:hypothetical protein